MKKFEHIPLITREEVCEGLGNCADQILKVLPDFTDRFQAANSENLFYQPIENRGWTNGFWTGEIWLAYEFTGDERLKEAALILGFLYSLSCVAAYKLTGNEKAKEAARFDNETGEHLCNYTRQGYSDDSAWSRGQAWAVYGPAISYKYTGLQECKDMYAKTAPYFMEHLPEDMAAYFDLCFTEGEEWPRDSSAAAIVACGMLEMAKYLEAEEAEYYVSCAKKIMKSLYDNYMVRDFSKSNGLLLHGTYCCKTDFNAMRTDLGKDECTSFGDYFFMEALIRLYKDWEMYW